MGSGQKHLGSSHLKDARKRPYVKRGPARDRKPLGKAPALWTLSALIVRMGQEQQRVWGRVNEKHTRCLLLCVLSTAVCFFGSGAQWRTTQWPHSQCVGLSNCPDRWWVHLTRGVPPGPSGKPSQDGTTSRRDFLPRPLPKLKASSPCSGSRQQTDETLFYYPALNIKNQAKREYGSPCFLWDQLAHQVQEDPTEIRIWWWKLSTH